MAQKKINTQRPAHIIAAELLRGIEMLTDESDCPIKFVGEAYFELVTRYIQALKDVELAPADGSEYETIEDSERVKFIDYR